MRYEIFADSTNPILNIVSVGYTENPDISKYGPAFRDQYIIHYCLSGKGYFNGEPVTQGQGFLITPNMFQEYHPDLKDPWEFIWIISNDEKISDLFSKYKTIQDTNIFNFYSFEKLNNLKQFLINSKNKIYSSYLLLEFVISVFNDSLKTSNSIPISYTSSVYFEAAINYINTHPNTYVKNLTNFLGITQPYLYKIFKQKTDLSPKQYILMEKLKKSKKLLKESNLTVTQVASAVGFSDVLDFSKFFTSKTGYSPQNFRKNN